jgi:hypothetical protein
VRRYEESWVHSCLLVTADFTGRRNWSKEEEEEEEEEEEMRIQALWDGERGSIQIAEFYSGEKARR